MEKRHRYRTMLFFQKFFQEFHQRQREKVQRKILWTLQLIEEVPRVPETYLKHLEGTDGLYEIRIQQGSDAVRWFCFFDGGETIIVLNGFAKKSARAPRNEIAAALRLRKEYRHEKT